jgi:hypothetical protein
VGESIPLIEFYLSGHCRFKGSWVIEGIRLRETLTDSSHKRLKYLFRVLVTVRFSGFKEYVARHLSIGRSLDQVLDMRRVKPKALGKDGHVMQDHLICLFMTWFCHKVVTALLSGDLWIVSHRV